MSEYISGPLSEVEKLAIENLVGKKTSNKEIKAALGRGPKSKVVDDFVRELKNSTYDHESVIRKLVAGGITNIGAETLVQKALEKLDENPSTDEVYLSAISFLDVRGAIKTSSDDGVHNNITALTPESQEQEAFYQNASKTESRSLRDCIYHPKG